tara:strand:- start:2042 stop:2272 length:231 start_codon:yes stop_codon:yes gene_type:complete
MTTSLGSLLLKTLMAYEEDIIETIIKINVKIHIAYALKLKKLFNSMYKIKPPRVPIVPGIFGKYPRKKKVDINLTR